MQRWVWMVAKKGEGDNKEKKKKKLRCSSSHKRAHRAYRAQCPPTPQSLATEPPTMIWLMGCVVVEAKKGGG